MMHKVEDQVETNVKSGQRDIVQAQMKKSWLDKFVILRSNPLFQIWNLINTFTCIVSSFLYMLFTAFGLPEPGTVAFILDSMFEFVFVADSIL